MLTELVASSVTNMAEGHASPANGKLWLGHGRNISSEWFCETPGDQGDDELAGLPSRRIATTTDAERSITGQFASATDNDRPSHASPQRIVKTVALGAKIVTYNGGVGRQSSRTADSLLKPHPGHSIGDWDDNASSYVPHSTACM